MYRSNYVDLKDFCRSRAFNLQGSGSTLPKPNFSIRHTDALYIIVNDKNATLPLGSCLQTAAQIRIVNFMPCSFATSYCLILLFIFLKISITRHVLVVLNILCSNIYYRICKQWFYISWKIHILKGISEYLHGPQDGFTDHNYLRT